MTTTLNHVQFCVSADYMGKKPAEAGIIFHGGIRTHGLPLAKGALIQLSFTGTLIITNRIKKLTMRRKKMKQTQKNTATSVAAKALEMARRRAEQVAAMRRALEKDRTEEVLSIARSLCGLESEGVGEAHPGR